MLMHVKQKLSDKTRVGFLYVVYETHNSIHYARL